jgi:AraC-like DNA-binding protein
MQSRCGHLTIHQSLVRAGTELAAQPAGWWFLRVCAGQGYLLDGFERCEIQLGDFIAMPAVAAARVRASQLSDLRLCHFGVEPEQLIGFFTAEERRALQSTGAAAAGLPRVFRQESIVTRQHADLCDLRQRESGVLVRSEMLSLAVQALRDILTRKPDAPSPAKGPEQRLAELTARLPESELLGRSPAELARECGCSERHLRRLFVERFGVPLLRRQIEWRIERAKQLLLETDAKIIDIAEQCGFRSLGLFNATFKRLTRLTPGAWRAAFATTKARHQRQHPSRCPKLARPRPAAEEGVNAATENNEGNGES